MIVLTTINVANESLPNFYIFSEKRYTSEYVAKCEDEVFWAIPKKRLIDAHFLFNE